MRRSTNTLTSATLKKWAYKKSGLEVLPQLEELPTVIEHADLLLNLVSDQKCPQRGYILNCLYSLVGRSVSKHVGPDIDQIQLLLNKVTPLHGTVILNWVTRSRVILHDLRKYDYVEWCEGGFVHKDLSI